MSLTCGFAGLPQGVASEAAGHSKVVCVRGGIAPKSKCVLAGVFALEGLS
jgi:hypothetical protein